MAPYVVVAMCDYNLTGVLCDMSSYQDLFTDHSPDPAVFRGMFAFIERWLSMNND